MNDTGWMALDEAQQAAGKAAARLVEEAELSFVMLLFADDRVGAVISNIEPANAVKLIEQRSRRPRPRSWSRTSKAMADCIKKERRTCR